MKNGEVQPGAVKVKAKHVDPAGDRSYYTVTMPNGRDRQTTIDRLQWHPSPDEAPSEVVLTRQQGQSWGLALNNHGLANEKGCFVNTTRPVRVTYPPCTVRCGLPDNVLLLY